MKKLLLLTLLSVQITHAEVINDATAAAITAATYKAGEADTTFATSGFYTDSTGQVIYAMQIQSDGKILIAGYDSSIDWYVGRLNSDGSVDTTFATNGFYTNSTGQIIYAMQIQSDGKILIAGYNSSNDWYVGRLNSDGSVDTTFATSGFYTNGTGTIIRTMEIQTDGKILIAGYIAGNDWYVGRLNSDGSVDTTFATSGFYTNSTGSIIYAMQIQTDGKILIAGYGGSTDWYVGRLNSDGSVDTTFATSGFYTNSTGQIIYAMQIQSDGKILIAGYNSSNDWYIGRLNSDGSVDTTFATSGFYTNGTGSVIQVMRIQSDGKILIAGYDSSNDWYVGRLTSGGSVDTDFATSGFYTNSTGRAVFALQILTNGKTLIAGYDSSNDWYVGRLINNIDPLTQAGSIGSGAVG